MKRDSPPDVNKVPPQDRGTTDNTCYLATASNMLAAAGYGQGATDQERADDIYGEMVRQFGHRPGHVDCALRWWLCDSGHHVQVSANSYRLFFTRGHTEGLSIIYPWNDPGAPRIIGNYLRECSMVGLGLSRPDQPIGHTVTPWGDDKGKGELSVNPGQVKVTDSDRGSGPYESYNYLSAPVNRMIGGTSYAGDGFQIDYFSSRPGNTTPDLYLANIVVLSGTEAAAAELCPLYSALSFRVQQFGQAQASELSYTLDMGEKTRIRREKVHWSEFTSLRNTRMESGRPTQRTWDFRKKPVPRGGWVTVNVEYEVPGGSTVGLRDVHFKHPDGTLTRVIPELELTVSTPSLSVPYGSPDATGGFLVGAFGVSDSSSSGLGNILTEYRFIYQYHCNQDPERHELQFAGFPGYEIRGLRFGHSYSYLDEKSLWNFDRWITTETPVIPLREEPHLFHISWEGKLPYPKGVDRRVLYTLPPPEVWIPPAGVDTTVPSGPTGLEGEVTPRSTP